jgi:phosphate transport system protein
MSRRLDPVLQNLRELVLRMGSRSEAILHKSLRAVWERDGELAAQVAADDLEIDRLDVEIDDAVLKVLALQHPVAEDLREVIAVKMAANELERVGDLARNIAKGARRLARGPATPVPANLLQLARDTQGMLRRALDCFGDVDAPAARGVLDDDESIDQQESEVIRGVLAAIPAHPENASRAVDQILMAKHLERVADHATNIAEGVILVAEARNVKHAQKLAH